MKKISDDLYILIKGLSKSEKAYFKKYSKIFSSGDTSYLKLFDAIDKQTKKGKGYDESILKTSLKNDSVSKQLSVAKTNLYNHVLKNLVQFHFDNSDNTKLHYLIGGVFVLHNKTLFSQAEKLLNRAKKFAYETENFLKLYELLQWEKNLIQKDESSNTYEKFNKIYEQEMFCIESLAEASAIKNIYGRAGAIFHYSGHSREKDGIKKFKELFDEPIMKKKGEELKAFSHKTFFYDIFVEYAAYTRDFENYYNYTFKSFELFELYPHQKKKRLIDYVLTFHNLMTGCLYLKKYEDYKNTLNKYEKFTKTEKNLNKGYLKMLDTLIRKHELIYFNAIGEFEKGVKYIDSYQELLKEFEGNIDTRELNLIHYFYCLLYFGACQFSKSLEYANKIINSGEPEQRKEIFLSAKIISILIHYELNNTDYMETLLRSCYRYLLSRKLEYKFERFIITFFKRFLNLSTRKEKIEWFRESKQKLLKFLEDPQEAPGVMYFDYLSWIESKIENRNFAEIVREKGERGVVL